MRAINLLVLLLAVNLLFALSVESFPGRWGFYKQKQKQKSSQQESYSEDKTIRKKITINPDKGLPIAPPGR